MAFKLRNYQLDAVYHMKNGCILCGGVGSGKSRTALAYYYIQQGGSYDVLEGKKPFDELIDTPQPLYIITTARKRDTLEWDEEIVPFLFRKAEDGVIKLGENVVIDSWNNIKKYQDIVGGFFIFDEQRVVGSGAWTKAFIKIARRNNWILLSATPGDKWEDYIPVFIANGFYKNRQDFTSQHMVFKPFTKYPQVEQYLNIEKLISLRNLILVDMDFRRPTVSHHEDIYVKYDPVLYRVVTKRWNPWTNEPIKNVSELCKCWSRVVNSDESRQAAVLEIFENKDKAIVFYNYDYELEILRNLDYGKGVVVAEWNGHKHEAIPTSDRWIYLVNYMAGAEGWNCIETDTIIFYSQNYSYRIMQQASGRIDRMNTPFKDLYFYHLKSRAHIDLAISRALKTKKKFNESRFVKW